MAGDLGSLHSLTGDKGAGGKEARRLVLLRLEAWPAGWELMLVFTLQMLLVMLPSKS